jgi:hypothetical protein
MERLTQPRPSTSRISGLAVLALVGAALVTPAGSGLRADEQAAAPAPKAPTAAQLLALTRTCNEITHGRYKTDEDASRATIPVCELNGAVFWKSDMDIDCDGQRTSECNENTDSAFQPDTALHDSRGNPLVAARLPYVVLPSPSSRFRFNQHGIRLGGVVAVIFNGKVQYAVSGDTGPVAIIGEGSFALAKKLGIDPDPETGGVDSGVTFIVFQGSKLAKPEDQAAATSQGQTLAQRLIDNN